MLPRNRTEAPACQHGQEVPKLPVDGSPLITRNHLSDVPCPLPRRIERVPMSITSRTRCSLPRLAGGSASAVSLSGPAQASLTLRPAGSLSHPSDLCREAPAGSVTQPSRSPASGPIDNYPGGTLLH